MKTYSDFTDSAFAWLVNPSNTKSTSCTVIRVKDTVVAVIPLDESSATDRKNGKAEDWYISVFPVLIPRGWFEHEIDTADAPHESFTDQVNITPSDNNTYRTTRTFVKSKASHFKALRVLTKAHDEIVGKDTTPKAPRTALSLGNQYSIEEQVKMSTHLSHERDGNEPLKITDSYKRNFDINYDRAAKIDLKDHASPDFQTWLNQKKQTRP